MRILWLCCSLFFVTNENTPEADASWSRNVDFCSLPKPPERHPPFICERHPSGHWSNGYPASANLHFVSRNPNKHLKMEQIIANLLVADNDIIKKVSVPRGRFEWFISGGRYLATWFYRTFCSKLIDSRLDWNYGEKITNKTRRTQYSYKTEHVLNRWVLGSRGGWSCLWLFTCARFFVLR